MNIAQGEKNIKTKIQTLALLDDRHKGSTWYHWRGLSTKEN